MLSVGGVAIAGMALGAENYRMAKAVFNQTMITTVFVSCMLSIVVLILFTPIMHLFHAGFWWGNTLENIILFSCGSFLLW